MHIGTWQLSGPAVPAKLAEHAACTQNGRQVVEQTCLMLSKRRHRQCGCPWKVLSKRRRRVPEIHEVGVSLLASELLRAERACSNMLSRRLGSKTTPLLVFVDNDNLTSDIHEQQRRRSCYRRLNLALCCQARTSRSREAIAEAPHQACRTTRGWLIAINVSVKMHGQQRQDLRFDCLDASRVTRAATTSGIWSRPVLVLREVVYAV